MTRCEESYSLQELNNSLKETQETTDALRRDITSIREAVNANNGKTQQLAVDMNEKVDMVSANHVELRADMASHKKATQNVKVYCDQVLVATKTALDALEPQIRAAVKTLGSELEDSVNHRHRDMREYVMARHDVVMARVGKMEKKVAVLPDDEETREARLRLAEAETSVRKAGAEAGKAVAYAERARGEAGAVADAVRVLSTTVTTMHKRLHGLAAGNTTGNADGGVMSHASSSINGINDSLSPSPAPASTSAADEEIRKHLQHPTMQDDLSMTSAARARRASVRLVEDDEANIAELQQALASLGHVTGGRGVGGGGGAGPGFGSDGAGDESGGDGVWGGMGGMGKELLESRVRQSEERLHEAIEETRYVKKTHIMQKKTLRHHILLICLFLNFFTSITNLHCLSLSLDWSSSTRSPAACSRSSSTSRRWASASRRARTTGAVMIGRDGAAELSVLGWEGMVAAQAWAWVRGQGARSTVTSGTRPGTRPSACLRIGLRPRLTLCCGWCS
jgi:uncharacterized protein YoxC